MTHNNKRKQLEIMKESVKDQVYKVGQKVYFSEGIEDKYFRGTIIKVLKISVRILNKENKIETIEKINLGIII